MRLHDKMPLSSPAACVTVLDLELGSGRTSMKLDVCLCVYAALVQCMAGSPSFPVILSVFFKKYGKMNLLSWKADPKPEAPPSRPVSDSDANGFGPFR